MTGEVVDGITPLDFDNAGQLPDTHTWIDEPIKSSPPQETIPVIDLNDPQAVEQMKTALETWGFFQLINHGIPVEFLAEAEHQIRRFFELPAEQKLRAKRSPESSTGYGIVPSSRNFNSRMWGEGFTVVGPPPSELARRVWPEDYSLFCDVIEKYQEQMKGLAEKLVSLLFKSLGLSSEDVEWFKPGGLPESTGSILQMNSYPKCPDPTRAMGLAPHTDSSIITVLYQSDTLRGLQVYRPDLNWVDIEPVKDAVVINVGDLMELASNGRFKSLLHRAVVSNAHHRISVAYFYGPNIDVKIKPPVKLNKDGFPMYQTLSWKEYLAVKDVYFFKSLEKVRFNPVAEEYNAITSGNEEAPLSSEVEEAREA
ncbi:PREDICTED: gibberellin 3-beta-dioxygenase 3-like [Ipomoea nil]|uniref:gibberellin 3-beta-dioxygenase 3-like n=1 Tax=Ipomoea nil TaxID=35883 RepID=UPI0009015515|nr:PREDICTED: gibberellin 3-beta-dioxygenase 3-like [Ipomoea nil]